MRVRAAAIVGLATLAALTLVGQRAGLGLTVVLIGVYAAAAKRVTVWWVLAAALATVATLRDATWVVVPAILASLATASYAASGGAAWRQTALGLVRIGAKPGAGVALLQRTPRPGGAPALRAGGIALVLLAVFVPLFASADAAFAHLLDALVPQESADRPVPRALLWAALVTLGGALVHATPPRAGGAPQKTLTRIEWALPLSILVALFATFVALQLTTLYGGNDYVLNTSGLTYAEYARTGFGQLIAASALTLAVIAATARYAPPSRLRTALLAALTLLTLVILASAYKRLHLYVDAYGLTRLRLAADTAILWLAALFALLLVLSRTAWMPRAVVALSATGILAFALSNPDGRIAAHNIERGRVDHSVLRGLSADAGPALRGVVRICPRKDSFVSLNRARSRARAACAG